MRPAIVEFQNHLSRIFPEENPPGTLVRTVTIQVTDECNLRCTYCYQVDKGRHVLDVEIAKAFLERILTDESDYISRKNCSGLILELIGGEPFMAIDVVSEISRWFINRMIELKHPWLNRSRISISSNGTLHFTPAVQKYLNEFRNWVSLSISLDGNKRLHDSCRVYPNGDGSYDQAVAAAKDLMARNAIVGSKLTLAPANIAYTAEALESMIELGYVSIFCNCVFEEGWAPSDATVLYRQLVEITDWLDSKHLLDDIFISIFDDKIFLSRGCQEDTNWCGGTGDMIAVDYKGDIFPCLRYMESSLGSQVPPVIIGTVKDGIGVSESQQEMIKCLRCVTWRSQCTDECHRCPINFDCAWCSAYNYQHLGSINRVATFLCEMHKARYMANVYFWVKYNTFMKIKTPIVNNIPRAWAIPIVGEAEFDRLNAMVDDYNATCGSQNEVNADETKGDNCPCNS